ncbi:MAG: hypothetical protein ACD_75C01145G0001, partial [uncultured bacterium]
MMKTAAMIHPGVKVAVVGLGISGRAAVHYARQCGAEVRVSDSRPKQRFLVEEQKFLAATNVLWEAGGHTLEFLRQADLILVSPGVNLELPVMRELRSAGLPLAGELGVAAGLITVPVVAVTGTNGKTTVTTLIGELLRGSGRKPFVGGNIGTPVYEYLCRPAEYDVVVVEVSSFQLESAGTFAPQVGVLLNITPDHLDRHGSLENYARVKMQLFKHQKPGDVAIINGDDRLCRKLPDGAAAEVRSFGCNAHNIKSTKSTKNTKNAAVLVDDKICLTTHGEVEEYSLAGTSLGNSVGMQNGAAAILAARALGCTREQIMAGLKAFRLAPHRIEFVAEVDGVSYYNDSKATNTGAVIAALRQFPGNVILIAGGRDKGDDYRLLRESVAGRVRLVLVIGESAGLLEEALADVVRLC